jgi:hypothetical protein
MVSTIRPLSVRTLTWSYHQYFARSVVSGIPKPQDLALGKIVTDELVDPLHIAHAGKRMTLHFEEILSIYAGDADGQSIDKRQVVLIFLDLDAPFCWIAVDRDPYSTKLEPKGPSHDGVTRFMNGGALPVISFVRNRRHFPLGQAVTRSVTPPGDAVSNLASRPRKPLK